LFVAFVGDEQKTREGRKTKSDVAARAKSVRELCGGAPTAHEWAGFSAC
jgi:hypothetical protein